MNKILLGGKITQKPSFSHTFCGKDFYKFFISVKRLSGTCDVLPCIAKKELVEQITEDFCEVYGEVRTRTVDKHIYLTVFVNEVSDFTEYKNDVKISGLLCREATYRKTPLGREISDFNMIVNRENSYKKDYIPCVSWGDNALKTVCVEPRDKIGIYGRFQSREYVKIDENGSREIKTAYEVSCSNIKIL